MGRSIAMLVLVAAGFALYLLLGGATGPEPSPIPPASENRDPEARDPGGSPAGEAKGDPESAAEGEICGVVRRGHAPCPSRIEVRKAGEGVFQAPGEPVWSGRTGEDGRFHVPGLARGGYLVSAVAGDGVRATLFVPVGSHVSRQLVHILIPSGTVTLLGRAVHEDGRPWRGKVGVAYIGEWEREYGTPPPVDAGEDGEFALPGLGAGLVRLLALDPERCRVVGPRLLLPAREKVTFVVDAGWTAVAGRVVAEADGTPIAGARVLGVHREEDSDHLRARNRSFEWWAASDADGRFTAYLEMDGWAEAEGFASGAFRWKGDEEEHVVRLARSKRTLPAGRIRGRVSVEGTGEPAAGARVVFGRHWGSGHAGTDGSYAIEAPSARRAPLYVWGGGWVSAELISLRDLPLEPLAVQVEAGKELERDLTVVRAAAATGRVLDSGGEPVAGATVRLETAGRRPRGRYGWTFVSRGPGGHVARTGADGSFRFGDLLPDAEYRARVQPPSGGTLLAGPFSAAPGGTAEIEVRLPANWIREVRFVFEGDRRPVVGAVVAGEVRSPAGWLSLGPRLTDHEGRVLLEVLFEGRTTLRVLHDSVRKEEESYTLPDESGPVTFEVRRGHFVGGRVVLPDGSPASGAQVGIEGTPKDGGRQFHSEGYADLAGVFRIGGLPPFSEATLTSSKEVDGAYLHAWTEPEADRDDQVLALELVEPSEPAPSLVVRPVGPDGKPVPRAVAEFWNQTYGRFERTTKHLWKGEARHRFREGSRKHRVEVHSAQRGEERFGAVLVGPLEKPDGELTVSLPEPRAVEGSVLDASGGPVVGAVVTAEPRYEDVPNLHPYRSHGQASSASDGSFRIDGLGDCEYELRTEVPKGYAPPGSLRVRGSAAGVVIRVPKSVFATITVLDWKGMPRPRSGISVKHPDSDRPLFPPNLWTDAEGKFRVGPLDPDTTYRLRIVVYGTENLGTVIEPWKPADTTVRLPRALSVSGAVLDPKGEPAAKVRVAYQVPGTRGWVTVLTEADGTFEVGRLPEGNVLLKALGAAERAEDAGVPVTTVPAGSAGVVLNVR